MINFIHNKENIITLLTFKKYHTLNKLTLEFNHYNYDDSHCNRASPVGEWQGLLLCKQGSQGLIPGETQVIRSPL